MPRFLRPAALLAALACSAMPSLSQAAEQAARSAADSEAAVLKALGVSPEKAVSYQDEAGRSLAREDFYQRLTTSAGTLSFNARKGERETVLQLQAAGKLPGTARYKVAAGESLPAFSLRSLDQATLSPDTLKGRYTLMSFYFAGCGPCVAEVPVLNGLQARMPELRLAAVTFDDEATSRRFVQDHGLRWPVYPQARPFLQSLGVNSFPAFALLSPEGKVVSIGPLHELQRSEQPTELLQRWVQEQIARDAGKT